MWKWLLGIFIVLVLGCSGGGYWVYSSGAWDTMQQWFRPDMKPTAVRLEPAGKGDLVRTVSAPGLTEPRTKVSISAQVSARIIALPFRENDVVKGGDVVVRLDARDLAANLDSAKAQLKSEEARLDGAKANYANAMAELGRRKELFSSKDASQAELDQAQTDFLRAESALHQSEFSIEIARANISRAEKDLDNAVIKAPFDGMIIRLNAEVGELVVVGTLNNAGSVIMQIANLSEMMIKAKVDEANIAPVKAGQTARVSLNAFPDEKFTATVERVQQQRQVDRDGTSYFETLLVLTVPAGRQLQWGLNTNCDIEVETTRDVLRVPSQAILDRPVDELPKVVRDSSPYVDKTKKFARVVYKMVEGKAVTVPVSIGSSDLTHTVVLGGLTPDEVIVTGPYKALVALKDGQRVVDEATVKKDTEKDKGEAKQADAGGAKGRG